MAKARWIPWYLFLMYMPLCSAERLKVTTLDEKGVGFKNVLVIVLRLDQENVSPLRFLTDSEGQTPFFDLVPGLYQFVATCPDPYGICRNSITESFVSGTTKEITLRVSYQTPIDVFTPNEDARSVRRHVNVRLLSNKTTRTPLAGVRVLVRGRDGEDRRWLRTDANGGIEVDLIDGPTKLAPPSILLIVPIGEKVHTFVLSDDCELLDTVPTNEATLPPDALCVPIKNATAEIELPIASPASGRMAPVPMIVPDHAEGASGSSPLGTGDIDTMQARTSI